MTNEQLWNCLKALAASLDGDRTAAEATIDQLEQEILRMAQPQRNEVRREMILVVVQLSRLEMRLRSEGGFDAAI